MQNVALNCAGGSGGNGYGAAYALCIASSREDRWQEAHPPKSGKGRKDA